MPILYCINTYKYGIFKKHTLCLGLKVVLENGCQGSDDVTIYGENIPVVPMPNKR
jgi:hypothetical protein